MSTVETSLTRRTFLASSVALPYALQAMAEPARGSSGWVLLGTDKGKGIYRAHWNGATGEIGAPELAFETDRTTFFARHPRLPVLYAANEIPGTQAAVSSLHITPESAELQLMTRRQTHGDNPCSVAVDQTGQTVFAANYTGGSMTAFKLGPEGDLAETVGVFRYNQATHGPVTDRQDAAHLHSTVVSPGNDFLLVCDLGDDVILVFPMAPDRNSYVGSPERIAARTGSGPRHVAFHPSGRWVYCIHELDCTVDLYDWNTDGGRLSMVLRDGSVVSTARAAAGNGVNTASELVVSADGRFLYTCTRGENTITVFRIDPGSGLLTQLQRLSCGGDVPRYIALDPTQSWLVCTNQVSSNLTVFARNAQTGRLAATPASFSAETPMFVLWV